MIKKYCDICERDLTGAMEDLFLSRAFLMYDPNNPTNDRSCELTLCEKCKKTLYYFMENPVLLKKRVNEMRLANRVRFLFRRKIKEEV